MPSKYDTNPLDPDFPEKAKAAAGSTGTQALPHSGAGTGQFAGGAPTAPTEEPTRRFDGQDFQAYQQPFDGQYVPAGFQPAGFANIAPTGARKIEKLGISENIATALPYLPWYLGMIAGVVLLFLMPKSEAKVRFHAAQGLAAHVGILIVTTLLGIVSNVTGVADLANFIFQLVMTIMLIVWTIKAWKGKPVHIESIDGLTNWLEEKIDTKLINT